MIDTHMQKEAIKTKAQIEIDKLSQQHVIATSKELHQFQVSKSKKRTQKLSLLRTQVKVISVKNPSKYKEKGSWTKNSHSIYLLKKATAYMCSRGRIGRYY